MALMAAAAAVAGAVSGAIQGGAQREQANQITEQGRQAAGTLEKAQQILKKSADQEISDIEAGNLQAQGLLTDSEAAVLTSLNQTESGQIGSIQAALQESDTAQGEILQDFAQAGLVSRETLSGAQGEALASFLPFEETGQRALTRLKLLTGLATAEEQAQFGSTLGQIEETEAFKFRRGQQEKQLERRQRAAGRVFSGKGLEEFQREIDALSGQEVERQTQQAAGIAQLGFQAAQQTAGIRQTFGLEQSRQALIQAQLTGATRERFATLQNNLRQKQIDNVIQKIDIHNLCRLPKFSGYLNISRTWGWVSTRMVVEYNNC